MGKVWKYFFNTEVLAFILIMIVVVYVYFSSQKQKKKYKFLGLGEDGWGNSFRGKNNEQDEFKSSLSDWWKTYGYGYSPKQKPKRKPKFNKHEERCREIFEKIYGQKFKTIRPGWLKNPVTNKNLELDGYCSKIITPIGKGLAFEYDGKQHSVYNKHFHRSGTDEFKYQIKKDEWKNLKCKEYKVVLIRIPHFVAYEDLERYIVNTLKNKGVHPSNMNYTHTQNYTQNHSPKSNSTHSQNHTQQNHSPKFNATQFSWTESSGTGFLSGLYNR